MLEILNVSKTIKGKKILNDVSLKVRHGEIAILLGSSGVGKSTLLRILNNLETYDEGKFFLDDKLLDLKTIHQKHTVSMVFQHLGLFEHLSVLENIDLPLILTQRKTKIEAEKVARDLLKEYQLEDQENKYPAQLSGGQKQRVALLRCLAISPKIICLDEPTSALDPSLTSQVATTINNLAKKGYIILVTTHDVSLVEKLNGTVYLMSKGSIVESAKVEELKEKSEHFKQIMAFMYGV